MARMTVRSTFALDPATAESLEALARRWDVSKSEALRRSVAAAAMVEGADPTSDAVAALKELQASLGLDVEKAQEWVDRIRSERDEGA